MMHVLSVHEHYMDTHIICCLFSLSRDHAAHISPSCVSCLLLLLCQSHLLLCLFFSLSCTARAHRLHVFGDHGSLTASSSSSTGSGSPLNPSSSSSTGSGSPLNPSSSSSTGSGFPLNPSSSSSTGSSSPLES